MCERFMLLRAVKVISDMITKVNRRIFFGVRNG